MFNSIKELLLNTPEKYWLVINDYHIHKSFWGVLLLILGIALILYKKRNFLLPIFLILTSIFILTISIVGQKYTHGKYKLELWEQYIKK